MTRFRDLGAVPGVFPTGKNNAITDVAGVRVGHKTLIEGESIRTGVTAILPHSGNLFTEKVPAAVYTINGFGKAVGFEQVRELGSIETPILLTNTLNVGKVADAVITYMIERDDSIWTINPVVGECNDSYLNDIKGRHVDVGHVWAAITGASDGPVAEGCVGAGTGTTNYGHKGGIGTASRIVPDGYHVGALLQTNFGSLEELTMLGVPVGQALRSKGTTSSAPSPEQDGSVMIVLATDAPLTARQLGRLAHRAAFGLARTGTTCHHGSGDFVIAFSTGYRLGGGTRQDMPRLPDSGDILNPLFQAVVETVEESVYNALIAAETMGGRANHIRYALPHDEVIRLLRYYRQIPE